MKKRFQADSSFLSCAIRNYPTRRHSTPPSGAACGAARPTGGTACGGYNASALMEAFLVSVAVVALGEIGDKTQLLALILAARFRRPWPIVAGILVATLVNHALAGLVGNWIRADGSRRTRCAGWSRCRSSPWPRGR